MYSQIQQIKEALATKEVIPHLTHYLVKNGAIHASDGRVTAATPVNYDGEFLVPGDEFEKVMALLKDDAKLTLKDSIVTVQNGNMKGRVKVDEQTKVSYDEPEGPWQDIPPILFDRLSLIRKFVSENAVHLWSLGICISKSLLFATNNIILAYSYCKEMKDVENLLLPVWAIDFILKKPVKPVKYSNHENYIGFLWKDGSWIKAQKIAHDFPEKAFEYANNFEEPTWEIPQQWKEAYKPIGEISEQEVRLYKDRIVGFKGAAEIEFQIETPTPENTEYSCWDPRFLNPIIEVAKHWQPDKWPKPATFRGEWIKGFILGRAAL